MRIGWQTKKLKIYIFLIIFVIIIVAGIFELPQFSTQLNLLALLATLGTLIWYTYDTHRIADQTIEENLRPLILRSGFIESWDDVKFSISAGRLEGKLLEFSILKNIAKDISGYIVVNKKKYQLLFANHISGKDIKDDLSDLEKHVLIYLYERYKVEKNNSPKKIATIYKSLGIKNREYVGTTTNSKYIETNGENFLLTDDGIRLMDSDKPMEYRFEPNWGWMNTGTIINGIFDGNKHEESGEENQIYLTYSDMEGNRYFTKENKNFSQNSGKL